MAMNWTDELPQHAAGWRKLSVTSDITLDVFWCRGRSARPLALVAAGVHGDEYEGPAAILDLTQKLDPARLEGTVTAVPVVNPEAFAAGNRTNPTDGLNLARCFPGNPHGSPTERLAAGVFEQLAAQADFLIDLHSGGIEYVFEPVAGFYGEPDLGNASFEAACQFGIESVWQLFHRSGVLSFEAWKRGVVAIGCEYHGGGRLDSEGRASYLHGILACLAHWGLTAPSADPPKKTCRNVFGSDWILAPTTGLFVAECRLGDEIGQGSQLASIITLSAGVQQCVIAPRDGVVLALRNKAYVPKNDGAVLLGQRLATRGSANRR
jgi:predicted deacylase